MSRVMAEDLRDKFGYPEEITKMPSSYYDLGLNCAVWDIQNKTLLQLVDGQRVARAYIGDRRLSNDEIIDLYSEGAENSPHFSTLKFP